MSTRYSLDRESFEALLANAFAVQKSGLDKESLSALVEIQQFIAGDRFDFDEEMRMVADRLLTLSKADGIAIALLEANALVYRAGTGGAAKNIGRHVDAVLNVSPAQGMGQEILRVEDAATDMRIEAEVCRQFGAMSLLMLPICENGVLRGVLQVLFYDAHSFSDREIRLCRLMVGALEEGRSRRLQHDHKPEASKLVKQVSDAERSSQQSQQSAEGIAGTAAIFASGVRQDVSPGQSSTNKDDNCARAISRQSQVSRAVAAQGRARAWKGDRTRGASSVRRKWKTDSWRLGVALVAAAVLGIITWLSSVRHLHTSTGGSAIARQHEDQKPITSKPIFANQEANQQNGRRRERASQGGGFERVQVSRNEVDYIGEDVTIRHLTTRSTKPQAQNGVKEVNFGDDVTVRYFAAAPPAASRDNGSGARPTPQIR
ncbi:MAG TPA: GAF domain-containing protein [Terriglobales bacterium]|nr:GAF domain-containing protein [Terriglobales bacterium]